VRISSLSKLSFAIALLALLCAVAAAQSPPREAAKMLPDQFGGLRAQFAPARPQKGFFESINREDYGVTSDARRAYSSPDGKTFDVYLVQTSSDAAAYSLFTRVIKSFDTPAVKRGDVGTVSVSGQGEIFFVKGRTFFAISDTGKQPADPQSLEEFARLFAGTIEGGENGLPTLVSHLPDWERTYEWAGYAVSLPALQQAAGSRPVLDAVSFEGGTEAVTSNYGEARLVIVEFTTPQYAADNDARINERIAQLRAAGQPLPSAYKRVGNYSVFVFDAPAAAAAEQLASSVKYEKDVRWLGRNPHAEEIATRRYTSTMGGVILTSLVITGLSILLCLGVGGIVGGAVFLRRRAKSATREAYSDAGGMLRLNIEDLNAPRPASKLIGQGEE
jgi:hypothetical protein